LQKCQLQSFQPYFNIQEVKQEDGALKVVISREIISAMVEFGFFDVGSIAIPISSQAGLVAIDLHLTNDRNKPRAGLGCPISGFPRNLTDMEPLKKTSKSTSNPISTMANVV
jgi:hypothetical protein